MRCSKCKQDKPKEDFYKETRNKNGYQYQCKSCKKKIDQIYRGSSNTHKEYQKSPNFILSQLKYRAKKKRTVFTLDNDLYFSKLSRQKCLYCGEEDTQGVIARYNPSKGYTDENTVPCCHICKGMKRGLTPEQFVLKCRDIINNNT